MRSNLDELVQELTDLRTLIASLAPVNDALSGHEDTVVRQYLTIRRRFDYAAFVVGLYASFEKFIENLIGAYAQQVAARRLYAALPEKLLTKHMIKSAELLLRGRLGEGRYVGIREIDVIKNLHDCLAGKSPYSLNTVAIVAHDLNLRYNELTTLFGAVGVEHVCQRALRADAMIAWFCAANGLDQPPQDGVPATAVEPRLHNLIDRRNQVAHRGGGPDDLLGAEEMRELVDFVEAFSRSLFAITVASYLQIRHLESGDCVALSLREGPYKDGTVVVVDKPSERLAVGQAAFVVAQGPGARWGRIRNLQLDDVSVETVDETSTAANVGILVDFTLPNEPELIVLQNEDDVVWVPLPPAVDAAVTPVAEAAEDVEVVEPETV